jgi:hypothetical protein
MREWLRVRRFLALAIACNDIESTCFERPARPDESLRLGFAS